MDRSLEEEPYSLVEPQFVVFDAAAFPILPWTKFQSRSGAGGPTAVVGTMAAEERAVPKVIPLASNQQAFPKAESPQN